MSLIDVLLIAVLAGLVIWVINLRSQIRQVMDEQRTKPPEIPQLTIEEMRQLQDSMKALVFSLEEYTDSQMQKIRVQSEAMAALCRRLEERLQQQELDAQQATLLQESVAGSTSTRVVPLSPGSLSSRHRDRDQILALHHKGWSAEKIAEELRLTKGEVQLIVNLA